MKVAVLLSGTGRTLDNFHSEIGASRLHAEIVAVASSSSRAKGVEKAKQYGYPVFASDEKNQRELSRQINEFILPRHPDVIVLAGFLKLFFMPEGFEGQVLNIHPALIPSFCGKGFYGMKVHRAVVDSGVKVTGCTVHFVSPIYDEGPIFLQECVPVRAGDTPEDVAARVFELECRLYPKALNLLADGRVKLSDNKVWIEE
ncbi:MAG: phosphoribosylglycinamide formyltransferase [Acidobacteria bacterium CG_4_9_14_3_um_filter_49_7]|nr:MAG: phosphoribosylglycinamide formyltransferase [Acidobacteria bacterium CG_4_9_14_3_um_filter_49_7]